MTYRELIDLYKKGKLDEEQKAKVEKDIEQQEAISEYLFDEGEIPRLEDLGTEIQEAGQETDALGEASAKQMDEEEKRFVKMIHSSIRKAFIKMGVTVSVIVLAVVLFIVFALPMVVDLFYYDPGEIVGVSEGGVETNRMSLDFTVYSELFLPETYRQKVSVEEKGYGEYDIDVIQDTSYTHLFTNVAGKIERNKMTLYNSRLLSRPSINNFVPDIAGVESPNIGGGAAGNQEEAKQALQELNDEDYYVAYVTLSEVLSYASFIEWCEKENFKVNPDWCAIAQKTNEGYETDIYMGFIYAAACSSMVHDEDYSYLTQWDLCETENDEDNWSVSEEVMTTHMVSMLRYMAEQKAFNKMMECEMDYEFLANNVEKNGLHIYGFTMKGKKDELIELSELEKVAYIYTTPVK